MCCLPACRRCYACVYARSSCCGTRRGSLVRVPPPLFCVMPTACYVCRQKSKDIEVDLWRFEVPPQTDSS